MRTITDPVAAIDDSENAVWTLNGNVLSRSTYQRGDVEDALASSAHVVHETFQTQRIEHAFLEPESTLAIAAPGGALQVYSGGQGIWDDRNQIASVLGVPQNAVRVELVSNGGRFRRQRGHGEPGANSACGLSSRQAGQVHVEPRRVSLDAPEAASDPHGILGGLR